MLVALGTRPHIGISVLQDRNPLWVRLSDGAIRNSYLVKIRNMESRPREVEIAISGQPAVLWDESGARDTAGLSLRLHIDPDQVAKRQLFVAAPPGAGGRSDIRFTVRALDKEGASATDHSFFERPEAGR